MTDSASLGRATLTIDIDRSAFDNELKVVRQQIEQFSPKFGGLDQAIRNIVKQIQELQEALSRLDRQAASTGRSVGTSPRQPDRRQPAGSPPAVQAPRPPQPPLVVPSAPPKPLVTPGPQVRPSSRRGGNLENAFGDALIGGAFPALFGQGPFASLGGALGGFAGGLKGGLFGFGLSLVGTGLGSAADASLQRGITARDALRDPIKQFDALQQAALLSSRGLERNVESLIAQGRTAEAAALVQDDLRRSFGDLAAFKQYQEAQDGLQRNFNRLGVVLSGLSAGPLSGFIKGIENFVTEAAALVGAPVPARGGSSPSAGQVRIGALTGSSPSIRNNPIGATLSPGLSILTRLFEVAAGREFGRPAANRPRQTLGQEAGAALAGQLQSTRLERTRGAATFFELRGDRLRSLQSELSAFDQNRANRLAAASPEERAGVSAQLVQERYRLEQQITAERRQQAQLDEQSANRVLALTEQTAVLRQTPFISARDARLLQEQAAFNEAQRNADAARNAARANPDDPNLRRAVDETAATLEQAAVRYNNQRIETEREAQRILLESNNRIASLRERKSIAQIAPNLSAVGVSVLQNRSQLNDVARQELEARQVAQQRPFDNDAQRTAIEAGERLRTAGQEFRSSIVQAFETAKREAENLRIAVRDIKFSIADRQTDTGPESLNSFLFPQLQELRQERAFRELLPQFEEAKRFVRSQFSEGAAVFNNRVNLTGNLQQDIATIKAFIQAVRPEQDLSRNLELTNTELAKATNSLSVVMSQLNQSLPAALANASTAIDNLAKKDWQVYVSLPGQPGFVPIGNTGL